MTAKETFQQAVIELEDALFKHCVLRVSDREVALDIVYDTFAKTWKHISDGKDIENMRAFLYRVLNNAIVDYYRKKKSVSLEGYLEHKVHDDAHEDLHFDETQRWIDVIDGQNILKLLQEIPDIYRQALTLRYIDELGPSEIAELTGESENVISVRIHRGIKLLQEKVSNMI